MLEGTAGEAVSNRSSAAGGGHLERLLATEAAVLEGTTGEAVSNRSSGAGGDSWEGC